MFRKGYSLQAVLKLGVALSVFYSFGAYAVDVSTWGGLETTEDVTIVNDIQAEGTPKVIPLNATTDQTIDGGGFNITGANQYSFSVNNTADLTFQNLGKVSDGTSGDNTFSYTDLDGNTVYKKIDASVNSFPAYLITRYKDSVALDVKNSVFTNNGGRIIVLSGTDQTLNITNSVFANNTSNQYVAMISGKGIVNVEDSIFYNNVNAKDDGGVFDLSGPTTVLSIKNSYFLNNSADEFGGAINQIAGILKIEGSKFEGNSSGEDGGAIALDGNIDSLEYIKDSEFINNRNGTYYDGGAISTTGGYIKRLENVVFDGNVASSRGGGVWGGMNSKHKAKDPVLLKNVTFKNNEAGAGGGYFSEGSQRQNYTYITDSEFSNNIAKKAGHYLMYGIPIGAGLLNTGDVPMVVNNTTFTGNIADTSANYSAGGGIYFVGDTAAYPLKLVDSTFTNNKAIEGGALFVDNADAAIIAHTKDVVFSGNIAEADTDTYNGGGDIYFQANNYGTLSLNAAEDKKIVFGGTIAAYTGSDAGVVMDINKGGVTYNTYDGTTETPVTAGTAGEIQFNNKVGDEEGNIFNISLYAGKLSIGQDNAVNANVDNPDGFINNNNFYVKGDSTLNTVNGVIGEFAPNTFTIDATMDYEFDIDLANGTADILRGAVSNGAVKLSTLNIIADADPQDMRIAYADTNVNGSLKAGYKITTSSATYDVSAENDDNGSYIVVSGVAAEGGLPKAIENASDAYSITGGADEVVDAWTENTLQNDLVINGNNHAILTENGLDGINVDSSHKLTMKNVGDVSGFNYAVSNEGTVELTNTTIHDDVINNGVLDVNSGVALQSVSGTGTMNINADHELQGTVSGNTVSVNSGATLSNVDKLASDTTLNAVGGTVDLNNQQATVKEANFDANSTLLITVNSTSDHGTLTANTMTVAEGAKLQATLAQGIVGGGASVDVQLLSAGNTDFDNFAESFDNNMYHFEKADKNGKYTITGAATAEDVIRDAGGSNWVANAAKAYVDGPKFQNNPVAEDVANKLAALVQNDAEGFITEMKALAPTETAAIQGQVVSNASRLFKTVDAYLHGSRDMIAGLSAGDALSGSSIWATPYVGKTKIDRRGTISGQKAQSLGLIAGLEKKLAEDLKLGVGLHYDETDISLDRRDIDTKTILGFVYGEYRRSRVFVNAIAFHAWSDYDEDKRALGRRYTANYNVHTSSIATAVGYQLEYITPEAGLHYYHIDRDGYTDTASQKVRGSHSDYLRATAGLRFATEYNNFHPYVYAGVNYDVISPKNNTVVNLANGSSYTVEGKHLPRLEYALNIGVTTNVLDNLTIGASYMGAYRKDYQEHTGFIKAKYDF